MPETTAFPGGNGSKVILTRIGMLLHAALIRGRSSGSLRGSRLPESLAGTFWEL